VQDLASRAAGRRCAPHRRRTPGASTGGAGADHRLSAERSLVAGVAVVAHQAMVAQMSAAGEARRARRDCARPTRSECIATDSAGGQMSVAGEAEARRARRHAIASASPRIVKGGRN
jgi:hypothetical protein